MQRRIAPRVLSASALCLLLTACFGGGTSPSPSAAPSQPSLQSPPASTAASSQASAGPSEAEPIDFTCDLPIHLDATVAIANITDVRVASHDGYDRVVFEFADGLPEALLERASPPFTHDASGEPIGVDGSSFLMLSLIGGTKQMPDGSSSYDGPTDVATDFPTLRHLVEGGDFEARSTWYFGLDSEACVNVFTLDAEGDAGPRIVIDVEH
jgi:hypothetical protein